MLLGVDVGGTFTDAVLFDGESVHTAKAPTTPDDQSRGVLAAIDAALERAGAEPGAVDAFAHGMTVGTNALLEESGARTALVATRGLHRPARDRAPGPPAASTASARRSRRRWSPTPTASRPPSASARGA